jgi:hypothetical protein
MEGWMEVTKRDRRSKEGRRVELARRARELLEEMDMEEMDMEEMDMEEMDMEEMMGRMMMEREGRRTGRVGRRERMEGLEVRSRATRQAGPDKAKTTTQDPTSISALLPSNPSLTRLSTSCSQPLVTSQ